MNNKLKELKQNNQVQIKHLQKNIQILQTKIDNCKVKRNSMK